MDEAKTRPGGDVAGFLERLEPPARREEAMALDALFRRVTGWAPVMWGPSMVGYGRYRYRYESGREGEAMATGFAPRGREVSVYLMAAGEEQAALLARLGPHRMGKGCLYLKRLSAVDPAVLEELVRTSLRSLAARWPVEGS